MTGGAAFVVAAPANVSEGSDSGASQTPREAGPASVLAGSGFESQAAGGPAKVSAASGAEGRDPAGNAPGRSPGSGGAER